VLKPEIVISGSLDDIAEASGDQLVFRPPEGEEDAIRVLDRQQERLAHHLGEGYRVIRGVAGSGKTLVLTFRAKWYAENFPNRKVLLTCFNVPLMKALEAQLGGSTNVTVKTIDSVAYEARRRSVHDGEWTAAREEATTILRASGGKYDVVLVDEAQDLDVAGLDLAYAALKKGRDDFVVALDGAQNVYRKSARWNPPNQTARGRSTILRLNYRNTKEILEFAHRFIGGTSEMPSESLLEDPTVIVPPEATSRRGPKPTVILCRDATHEVETILDAIQSAHEAGVRWGDMAVLYGARRLQTKLYYETQSWDIPYFWVSMNHHTKKQVIEAGDVVRCATMQGLKGLEFSRVFMCGVNDIYDPGGTDDDTVRRIAYVAMTRAMDELTITVSGNGPIGTAIQAASR
jgi:superfamily I DNA/RNA helicase